MSPVYTVFYGTFIDLPRSKEGDRHVLTIRHGVLWASVADGTIEGTDWTITSDADLAAFLRKQGWVVDGSRPSKSQVTVTVVRAQDDQNEFFFPGFIGLFIPILPVPVSSYN